MFSLSYDRKHSGGGKIVIGSLVQLQNLNRHVGDHKQTFLEGFWIVVDIYNNGKFQKFSIFFMIFSFVTNIHHCFLRWNDHFLKFLGIPARSQAKKSVSK